MCDWFFSMAYSSFTFMFDNSILRDKYIFFAENLYNFDTALSRKGIHFVTCDGDNRASTVKQRIDSEKGYEPI